jgi:hypothetical protein
MLTHANLLSNNWINGFGDVSTPGSLSSDITTFMNLPPHYDCMLITFYFLFTFIDVLYSRLCLATTNGRSCIFSNVMVFFLEN